MSRSLASLRGARPSGGTPPPAEIVVEIEEVNGPYFLTTTAHAPATAAPHDYQVIRCPALATLDPAKSYRLRVQFREPGCSFDCSVLKSLRDP